MTRSTSFHHFASLFFFALLSISTVGCDFNPLTECEPPEPDPSETVDPANPDALTRALVIPDARLDRGNPPPPTGTAEAPTASGNADSLGTSNGSTLGLPLGFTASTALAGVYLQVDGADSFFDIPVSATSQEGNRLTVPITLPTNVEPGRFCTSYCVYDTEGRVSNIVTTCVDVLELGSGALQVSLSWNTGGTDLDLWVTDPSGTRIYYGNPASSTGGQLDRDDTDGFGPENIFWAEEAAPDGEYLIEVDYYGGSVPTDYVVTVTGPETSRRFTGRLISASERDGVTVVTKRGSRLSFSAPTSASAKASPLEAKPVKQ